MRAAFAIALFSLFSVCPPARAAETDPTSDPDFLVQGEYNGARHSMHVIAQGDGEFQIVVYEGPLEKRSNNPPRRLDGDSDLVEDLCDSLDVERVERKSPTLGKEPPKGAVVLFDGTPQSLGNWQGGQLSEDGFLKQGTESIKKFRDYSLHLEFRTPWMPNARGQGRGNSGVYHQGRYETQVLDSFGLSGQANETGGIYSVKAPDSNACLPPMQWQTYDVDFTAARFDGDKKVSDARMTVRLNGVMIQNDVVVPHATTAAKYREGSDDGPIYLQDHGNEVRFRNIWLVPRDAEREASRPIVPGFERFFASATDEKGLGGEMLISTLGCTSCHQGSTGLLPIKQGPNLSNVRSRVRPDALVSMISDPHRTKRGTTMPDPWMGLNADQRKSAAESIASYLLLTGSQDSLVDRPAKSSSIRRGQELYHSVGCVACHAAFDGTKTPLSTTVPLGDVETKYTVDSLANLIAKPHQIRSGARMPSLVGSLGDAYAIASYLTRKVTRRESKVVFRRRIYKGEWDKLPDFDKLEPVSEDSVPELTIDHGVNPKHTGIVFESKVRIITPGTYEFSIASDDGSRLIVGPHRVDNDGVHPTVTKSGTFELEPGTYPVRVEWFNKDGGVSLSARVKDPVLGDLDLRELIDDGETKHEPLMVDQFQPNPAAVERGSKLFQSAGCASCHEFQSDRSSSSPQSGSLAKLTDVRLDRGCLANSVTRPAVDYHLSPRQREAISRAIELRREVKSTAYAVSDSDLVHQTLAALNCYACHRRGEFGGPEPVRDAMFKTTMVEMGWEGRLPPPLDGVGDKLRSEYMEHLFAAGANERPYMHTRMPGFGEGSLKLLLESLVRLDRQTGDRAPASADATESKLNDGRKLVGASGLSCIKCHSYNDIKGGGIGAIDLLAMPNRLRADWFSRYLRDPTKYRPGTRMPNSFPEGRSAYTKLYEGDPHRQIDAIWGYLDAGDSVKEPTGLRAGSILLTATDRPRIYRNFFEGISGRGIAVGFPDEVNLIWDAEKMGLPWIWKNEFIDAARHWTGRGQGRTTPAGDQVNQLEMWTPVVRGDAVDMTWPQQTGRELGHRFRGYQLDTAGNPTFRYSIGGAQVEDSIRPIGAGGFQRQLNVAPVAGQDQAGLVWRIARSETIEVAGDFFKVGAITLTIDGARCEVVKVDGQLELRALLPGDQPVSVTQVIQW